MTEQKIQTVEEMNREELIAYIEWLEEVVEGLGSYINMDDHYLPDVMRKEYQEECKRDRERLESL